MWKLSGEPLRSPFAAPSDTDRMLIQPGFLVPEHLFAVVLGQKAVFSLFNFRLTPFLSLHVRCQLYPGSIFLLDAFAPGNLNVQGFLDCKIATFKMQTGRHAQELPAVGSGVALDTWV